MIVIFTGERDWPELHRKIIDSEMDGLLRVAHLRNEPLVVRYGVSGNADTFMVAWSRDKSGVVLEPYPPDWMRFREAAGPIRNKAMVVKDPIAELCVALWGGRFRTKNSKREYSGTFDCLQQALLRSIPVRIVPPPKDPE